MPRKDSQTQARQERTAKKGMTDRNDGLKKKARKSPARTGLTGKDSQERTGSRRSTLNI
jgi:hypothetical protein